MSAILLIILSVSALAKDKKSVVMTTEMRGKAALMLEQMAVCLRSQKTSIQCYQELQTNCSKILGEKDCPMIKDVGGVMYLEGMSDSSVPKN
ncbi:MAG: hypothetical protein A2381_00420 [Bdellovibrionales bacterium RIFOXYB1_FULL_37_110]|nr:MAG: hypothetical protein A2417_11475 [Bdellovibrionales bacterium RIFOXYC1_FULL_37_79]OFZ60858.1 MAG: hypothetical protein A2381_00420 [Bdellovibrionales bacterium RIFOXYB1_FULL_37_110]OFZ62388.1 MAG: hypothetical protein A2577_03085 [Bdellovibrionales bacterium RIFOXYD1_FULL_36_51]